MYICIYMYYIYMYIYINIYIYIYIYIYIAYLHIITKHDQMFLKLGVTCRVNKTFLFNKIWS